MQTKPRHFALFEHFSLKKFAGTKCYGRKRNVGKEGSEKRGQKKVENSLDKKVDTIPIEGQHFNLDPIKVFMLTNSCKQVR